MRTSGVYAIRNLANGRRYIGSSVHISNRWSDHLSRLRRGIHHCAGLQSDWNVSGPETFGWEILEVVADRVELIPSEQRWLDENQTAYNAARRAGGGPREGFRHTAASKSKMSAANLAAWQRRTFVPMSASHREACRLATTGRKHSVEQRAKISAGLKGRVITWGAKISAAKKGQTVRSGKKGVPWSVDRWHTYALQYRAS